MKMCLVLEHTQRSTPGFKHGQSMRNGAENKIHTNQNTSKGQNSGLAIQHSDEDPSLILSKYI